MKENLTTEYIYIFLGQIFDFKDLNIPRQGILAAKNILVCFLRAGFRQTILNQELVSVSKITTRNRRIFVYYYERDGGFRREYKKKLGQRREKLLLGEY